MKILFLSNSIGGLINFRYDLIKFLCDRKDTVYILSPCEQDTRPEVLTALGCVFIQIKMHGRGTNPLKDIKILKIYKHYLKEINPNVVLTYTAKPNIYGGVACRQYDVPVISSVTGLGMAIVGKSVLKNLLIWLYKWGFRKTNYVFFQNEACKDFFKKNNIETLDSSIVPGSGVNIEHFYYVDYPTDEDNIVFLYVGKLLIDKGSQHLFDAIEYCHEKYHNVRFHIVGPKDSPELFDRIDKLNSLGFADFYGKQFDVRPYIKGCHCIVHPSYHEGMSNAILEGSSMGRPVITTNINGCKEIVEDGKTGYLCDVKSSRSLIEKIDKFISQPYDLRKQMGIAAREKVVREFDRADVVKRYIDIIDRLSSKKNNSNE